MDEKVWKIGKNRGVRWFFKGKSEFWGFWGRKGGYFEGFTLIGDGFWINRGVCRGNAGKGVGNVWSCSEDRRFKEIRRYRTYKKYRKGWRENRNSPTKTMGNIEHFKNE